jgi:hypothetical protein
MVNGATWEEQGLARLKEAQEKEQQAKEDLAYWSQYRQALETVLELERKKRALNVDGEHSIDPESLRRKSIREALIEIGGRNNGLVVVQQAVDILIQANVPGDRDQVRNAIYSTLHYSKSYFQKERPGVYHLTKKAQLSFIP